jgi:hypothetical protein
VRAWEGTITLPTYEEDPPDANFDKPTLLEPVDVPRDHSDSAFGNSRTLHLRCGVRPLWASTLHVLRLVNGQDL